MLATADTRTPAVCVYNERPQSEFRLWSMFAEIYLVRKEERGGDHTTAMFVKSWAADVHKD